MKTITVNLYQFDELSEEAKEAAVESLFGVNLDDWYQFVYEDAKEVGIKIKGFDIDRGYIEADLDARETAEYILKSHGKVCETYKIARTFSDEYDKLVLKYSDGTDQVTEENQYDFDQEADELEYQFKKDISREYLTMLKNEYEYCTSEESIIETIRANEYWFTEAGKLSRAK